MTFMMRKRFKFKRRKPHSHKGDYGRVFVLAGSKGLTGAAHLASVAALRSGAGLVTLGTPEAVYPVLARREAEVMVRPFASTAKGSFSVRAAAPVLKFLKSQDVLAIGPGLSPFPETQRFARSVIGRSSVPLVIDADGLNALKGHTALLKRCSGRAVLTPHPGEFKRLFGGRLSDQEALRKKRAQEIADQFNVIVVLKGHRTVVACRGKKVYVNRTGNAGMAAGGTGDVLTGILAALIGQGFSLFDAACFGVYLHGLAGDLAAKKIGEVSLTAGDMLCYLVPAVKQASPGRS